MLHTRIHKVFFVFTAAVFIALMLPEMCQEGMFMDGTIYAAIARNLSIHIGDFWHLKFSDTTFPVFNDHPPLAFGLESLFFKAFGEAFYAEKLYGFCCAIITAFLIIRVWKHLFKNHHYENMYWLPLLLWMITPKVFWSFNNNMLENTLTVFSTAAILLLLKSIQQPLFKQILYLFFAGIMLIAAFLSKGFPGLFPLAFFFFFYVSAPREFHIKRMLALTGIFVCMCVLSSALFLLWQGQAIESLGAYLNIQVFNSIKGGDRVGSRWNWLNDYFQQIIPMLGILLLVVFSNRKFFIAQWRNQTAMRQSTLLMLLIALSASLPLMVSPKLSAYYLVPCFPFMAMAFAIIMAPNTEALIQKIDVDSKFPKRFFYFNVCLIAAIGIFSILQFGNKFRDEALLRDIEKIQVYLPSEKTISIAEPMYQDWRLIAYFQRKAKININREPQRSKYLLIEKNQSANDTNYKASALILEKFTLFERNAENNIRKDD